MAWQETPENEALKWAFAGWSSLVLVPGLLFVFGVIWLVMPPYKPPPQDWANGTYTNSCCAPLVLRDGTMRVGDGSTRYFIADGKTGMQLVVKIGIGVRRGAVAFGGTFAYADFTGPRTATHGKPDGLRLFGRDDDRAYLFVRQK